MILLGEHGVVHGCPAIAGPVSIGLRAQVRMDGCLAVEPLSYLKPFADPSCERLGHPLLLAISDLSLPDDFGILVTGDLVAGVGMGFSAALAYSISLAIDSFLSDIDTHPYVRAEAMENHFHGGASGVDLAAVSTEGLIRFARKAPSDFDILPVECNVNGTIVGAAFAVDASTRELVAGVASYFDAQLDKGAASIAEMGKWVASGERALCDGDILGLGNAMNRCQSLLDQWGVSFPANQLAIDAARAAGAIGAKLSGAGGGGLVIALCDETNVDVVREALLGLGPLASFSMPLG